PARAPTAAPSPLSLLDALPISPPRGRPAPPEPAVRPDLLLALAAAAAVPRPDPGPGRLRVPVRQGTVAPDPRGGDPQRAGHHADRARADRRGDDFQPVGDGDRRRLRDLRLAPEPAGPPRPAGVAEPRQRLGAEGEAGDG